MFAQIARFFSATWPWYVAGPLIGLFVPALLIIGNRMFGISSALRHACAATVAPRIPFFNYDWRTEGAWNLVFVAGIVIGGGLAGLLLANPFDVAIAEATRHSLAAFGIHDFTGLVPAELFSWRTLVTPRGATMLIGGGFLVGFGSSYAGGCTSGHAISGVADLQPASLIAVIGFFAGGLMATWLILPYLLS